MATFVLVHGAWEAGWVWRQTAARLRDGGHEVFTPSLTGLGERAHLAGLEVNLDTHIEDVLGVLKWERLENVTLVGHSYGGMVITGAADRAAERIGALIYLDAFIPDDGQALTDLIPPERAAGMEQLAAEQGEGWYLPLAAAAGPLQHVTDPAERALLDTYCVPQPLACMTQKLALAGGHESVTRNAFILASGYQPSSFTRFVPVAEARGWPVAELPTHHFPMLSMAEATAEVLMAHAA